MLKQRLECEHMFKKIIQKIGNLKARFKPYEEELLLGMDIETLLKDPYKNDKIKVLLAENDAKLQGLSEEYHTQMNNFIIVERVRMSDIGTKDTIQSLCKQLSELKVSVKEAEEKNVQAKSRENPHIRSVSKDIAKAIKVLKEHETNQNMVKKDLDILEGEKQSLLFHFTNLRRALSFLKYFMLLLVFITLIVGIVLSTLLIVYNRNVFLPSLISIVTISFLFLWGFVFRRYCVHEIEKNQRLQERAVKLINKTKLKFIRNQQLLDFEYEKYQVNSSEVLELRYEHYLDAQQQQRNYDHINRTIRNLSMDIEDTMNKIQIENASFVIKNAEYFATDKGIDRLYEKHHEHRERLQKELKKLEHEKEVLENLLTK
jgi:hypothetical protein